MPQRYRFGRFEVRPGERRLLADGQPGALGARAFDLLLMLIENRQRLVTKEELLRDVWPGLVVGENNLHTQVSTLRGLLGPQAIGTIAGRGYRFTLKVDSEPAAVGSVPEASVSLNDIAADDTHAAGLPVGTPATAPTTSTSGTGRSARKLAAILSADVVGYSRLMGEDDQATLEAIVANRSIMATHITRHGGRVVDATGDALLGEFPSAIESVRCALAIQTDLAQRNAPLPESRRMVLRIGLNVGDVIEQDAALYGEGVNVAARLQAMGEPGGVCISGSIFDQVDGKLPLVFRFAGEQAVKNIAKAVRAYHVGAESPVAAAHPTGPSGPKAQYPVYRFGKFEVRPDQRLVLLEGAPAMVGARAFDVLLALIERRDRVVSKHDLLDIVWPDVVVEENNLQTQVSTLRKLLGLQVIETIPGRGYRFVMALEDAAKVTSTLALPTPVAVPQAPRLTNLPAAAEALFGRSSDLDALTDLVAERRLVTVLGTGGIGKTCLVQALARRLVGRYVNGVWWVDLASVASADHIALAIASAANLQLGEGDTMASLLRALSPRETLLVLDNCENMLGDIAQLVQAVLAAAPRLRIVATSQETLSAPSEQIYRLDPLAVPPPGTALDEARACSALQLFEQRARAADRHFSLNASNVAGAIRLCRRLDGIPLAIEMAAARLPLMGLIQLEANLGERLRLLKGNNRGAPARQKTLRATLDWSHALLTADEQAVLRRLATFAGSFRLDMAQRVAVSSEGIDEWAVLDLLAGLVDKSLVQLEQNDPPRYRLLETTRLYATERLAEHHETEAVAQRHGQAMALLADEAEQSYWVTPDTPWLNRYAPDYDDLQVAFERACREHDGEVGAATLDALFRLDHLRAIIAPIRSYLHTAFESLQTASPMALARLNLRFATHFLGGAAGPKLAAGNRAVAAFREVGDQRRLYEALMSMAANCAMAGEFDDSDNALSDAQKIEDPRWPPRLHWFGAYHRARVHTYRGDAAAYRECVRAELLFAERAGSSCQAANARLNLADAALMAGEWDEAITLGRAAVDEVRTLDLPQMLAVALLNLSAAMLRKGDLRSARVVALEALPVVWRNKLSGYFLCHLSLLAASLAQHESAAQMLGYVEAWLTANRYTREPSEACSAQLAAESIEATLPSLAIGPLKKCGGLMTEAQAYVLAEGMLTESGHSDDRGAAPHVEPEASTARARRR